jgi:uncharacterized membrane protein
LWLLPEEAKRMVTDNSLRRVLNRNNAFTLVVLALSIILFLLPTGFESRLADNVERARGQILEVDNSVVMQYGLVKTGGQKMRIRIIDGEFAGQEALATNNLTGKMEMDKIFSPGDVALVALTEEGGRVISATAFEHYRLDVELVLVALFGIVLVVYAGWIGIKSLLSFGFTALIIWKALLPGILRGWDPIILALVLVAALTGVTMFLIAGLSRRALAAYLGTLLGVVVTCVLALVFSPPFKVHGAVEAFSETLLYSGFPQLDLTRIFLAGIFFSASGAIMDVAVDIATATYEVVEKKPDISLSEVIKSGLTVGRAVTGTMVTTLLLAYTGSSAALLMLFMGQGVPMVNMLSINYVSAEILKTMVGSFGLVTVAPFTALMAGLLFVGFRRSSNGFTPSHSDANVFRA